MSMCEHLYKNRCFGSLLAWSFQKWVNTMPWRKDVGNDLKEANVADRKSGKRRAFLKNLKSIILHGQELCTSGKHSRHLPKLQKKRVAYQTLCISVSILNVKVYDCRIGKRWLVWNGCLEKASSLKKNIAQLMFAKLNLNKPENLWTDETKEKLNTVCQHKHLNNSRQARWWKGDDLDSFCSHGTWTPYSQSGPWAPCEAICPADKAWLKSGHATGQWSQEQQKIYKRMVKTEWRCCQNLPILRNAFILEY